MRLPNHMPWICDCTSARVRDLAKGQFTAVVPGEECQRCGRDYETANADAHRRIILQESP